jgi:hypothetical protein
MKARSCADVALCALIELALCAPIELALCALIVAALCALIELVLCALAVASGEAQPTSRARAVTPNARRRRKERYR